MQDVRQVLGNSSTDLGTLCKASQINMWAKYKPVVLALIDTVSQFDRTNNKWKSSATWWKGSTGTCGIVPYSLNSAAAVIDHCNGSLNGWSYTKPSGGLSSPYRLTDFAGYYHSAVPPIDTFRMETYNTQDAAMVCHLVQTSDTNLTLADLNNFNGYYLAFYAKKGTSSKVVVAQSSLGNNGNAVDFQLGSWNAGTWSIYPFITDSPNDDGTIAAVRFSCPQANAMSFVVVENVITIWTTNVAVSGIRTVTATIHIKNNTNNSVTLNNNYYKIRFANKTYDDPLVAGESSGAISNITVASNTETTINFSANADISTLQTGAYLWIQMAGSSITSRDVMPIPYTQPV